MLCHELPMQWGGCDHNPSASHASSTGKHRAPPYVDDQPANLLRFFHYSNRTLPKRTTRHRSIGQNHIYYVIYYVHQIEGC